MFFQENWYKHFDVEERGKRPGQTGLAPQLFVKEVLPSEIRGALFCVCMCVCVCVFSQVCMGLHVCLSFPINAFLN